MRNPRQISSPPYQLEPLAPDEATRWDQLISPYESRELFHQKAWLDYLAASRHVDIHLWAIRSGRQTVGYFCGGILRMGLFRILGSPLKSWNTNVMGPLINADIDKAALLQALDALAHKEHLVMTELEHPILPDDALEAAGFEVVRDWTYIVSLTPGNQEAMWQALDSTCRNRIRKAMKAGLTVEDCDGPEIADEYYDMYSALMRRKVVAPPFPREHACLLVSHLKKADCLFALRVKDQNDRVLAVGLFPHDDKTMYFWSGASWEWSHDLCPNDLLHWRAMCLAAERGLRLYNMSGHGRFKGKFGGTLVAVKRWHKCYWRSARWARNGYQWWSRNRRSVHGRWLRALASPTASHESRNRHAPIQRQRAPLCLSDIWKAPLHDFPIRDEILYQYLPLSADMEVLEIGPGSGVTAFRISRQVRQVTLLDVAPRNIAQLQARLRDVPNLRFVCADACDPIMPKSAGGPFDAVYALEVFELLPDPQSCLKNIAAVLRSGGHLLLQFPNYPPPRSPGMTYFHTRSELDRLMSAANFTSWDVYALRLRRHASGLYQVFHERPIRFYRRLRSPNGGERPLVYDESWAFQHGHRLEQHKYLVHGAWAVLAAAMRLGGEWFEDQPLGEDILHRNLLVLARR